MLLILIYLIEIGRDLTLYRVSTRPVRLKSLFIFVFFFTVRCAFNVASCTLLLIVVLVIVVLVVAVEHHGEREAERFDLGESGARRLELRLNKN